MLYVWEGRTAVSTSADCWLQSNIVTECQHYCLSPWWSFMGKHLAHTPLSIPSSFSMHQKPPLSSDIQNTFPLFLLYMSPSTMWWLWLLHCEGNWERPSPLNSKALTENWNQTSKISQPSFNIRTNNAVAPAPALTLQSYAPQRIQRHGHRNSWVLRTRGVGGEVTLLFLHSVCMRETQKQDESVMQLGAFPFITTGRITIWEHSFSSWLVLGTVMLVWGASSAHAVGLPAKEQIWERVWSEPPEGTGNLCEMARFVLLFSWLFSKNKRKNYNARLLRQIITLYSKEAKDGRKGKDP